MNRRAQKDENANGRKCDKEEKEREREREKQKPQN